MKRLVLVFLAMLLGGASHLNAATGKRKALLIGNDTYSGVGFKPLNGAPSNDVDALKLALVGSGFDKNEIVVRKNLNSRTFLSAIVEFAQGLQTDDSVLVYYSGHGFSLDQVDYLVSTDFSLVDGLTKADAINQNVSLVDVLAQLTNVKTKAIILDACRSQLPVYKSASDPRLANLEQLAVQKGTGSLIGYSTSNGKVASGTSPKGLSLYTQYLVNSLNQRPSSMLLALAVAKNMTYENSSPHQVAAFYDEMGGGDFPLLGVPPPPTPPNLSTWDEIPTGLSWTTTDNHTPLTWTSARYYCSSLSIDGYTDWRLPTLNELRGLHEYPSHTKYQLNPAFQLSDRYMWTSTLAYSSATTDAYMRWDFKKTESSFESKNTANALCVRDNFDVALNRIFELARRDDLSTLTRMHDNDADNTWSASITLPGSAGNWVWGCHLRQLNDGRKQYYDFVYESVYLEQTDAALQERIDSLGTRISTLGGFEDKGKLGKMEFYKSADGLSFTIHINRATRKLLFTIYPRGIEPKADDYND